MKQKVAMVLAPHADDETLGCGGTIGVLNSLGYRVVVCLVCGHSLHEKHIYSPGVLIRVFEEFESAMKALGVEQYECLGLPNGNLSSCDVHEINLAIEEVLKRVAPEIVFVPNKTDLHQDHKLVTYAAIVALRPYLDEAKRVKAVYEYEVLSETDIVMTYQESFIPDTFVNIEGFLDKKLQACECYKSQMQVGSKPRSVGSVQSLAELRGRMMGERVAEAFRTIYKRELFM